MQKRNLLLNVFFTFIAYIIFTTYVKAANPLELTLFTNEANPKSGEKTKIYLIAKSTNDLEVNGVLTGIKIPKDLNVSNLNLEIPTSFVFNHIESTDHTTYTQIEVMLAKKTGTFFTLKNNDPIISFDVDGINGGVFTIEPMPSITTSVIDINQSELFEKYNPASLSINVVEITPTPTPEPTIIPTITIVPSPDPTPSVYPTPEPTIISTPSITPTPYFPTTFNIPTKIEAEYFNKNESSSTFEIVNSVSASNNARIGYIKKDSFAIYNVFATSTKKFDVTFSYSSNDNTVPDKSLSIFKVNNTSEEFLGTLDIENTGSWDTYKQQSLKELIVDSDTTKIKVVFNTDYFDVDYMEFSESIIPTPIPTIEPSVIPTPTPEPTTIPTITIVPSPDPTPSVYPTPTIEPTVEPTVSPTIIPTPTVIIPTPSLIPTPTTIPTITPTPSITPIPYEFQLTNLFVRSNERYIHVIKGLVEKNRMYIDRRYKFKYIPQALNGLDYIRTANDDKKSTGSEFLTFDINKKTEIFVAHDVRIKNKPEWLKSYTNTGLTIKGDLGMNFTVYKKVFESGKVVLGGNQEKTKRGNVSNYIVIIKPLEK